MVGFSGAPWLCSLVSSGWEVEQGSDPKCVFLPRVERDPGRAAAL